MWRPLSGAVSIAPRTGALVTPPAIQCEPGQRLTHIGMLAKHAALGTLELWS